MSELDFALDGLYAAGWWPTQSDPCLQSPDQRWYPCPDMIRDHFAGAGIDLVERTRINDRHVTLSWVIPGHGREAVTAQTHDSAYLLAFTHLYKQSKRDERALIGN